VKISGSWGCLLIDFGSGVFRWYGAGGDEEIKKIVSFLKCLLVKQLKLF